MKVPSSRSFLPFNVNSSMIRLEVNVFIHNFNSNTEMNMVVYGCALDDGYGKDTLFKSAKLIEDAACIDILQFQTLDTYTACGDEVVDEDQKLVHAKIGDNNEFVDVECRVENQKTPFTNIRVFFNEPRVLTVTAYIDPSLVNEQISHISCVYTNKSNAICEWIRIPESSLSVSQELYSTVIFYSSSFIVFINHFVFSPSVMHVRYYAQKESDSECIGPGDGIAILLDNYTVDVTIEYRYSLVPKFRNTMNFKYQILYVDNQRAALYWCFLRAENGTCIQHDVNLMIRSRHFTYNDLSMMLPYLEMVCIEKDSLRWFDLHSQCGSEMSASTQLRRDLITLSHYDVLHILTNVQKPNCLVHEVKGVRADLGGAGTWFLMARFDEMALDTYAMVMRLTAISNTTAVLRLFQSAALPGEPLDCFTRVFTVKELQNGTDYFYELHFEASTKNSTTMIFRFLFFNRHVGVLYSCLSISVDGKCDERAIYVISRHETIDHAELIVLEKVAKAVCVDPQVLYHTASFDECVYDHAQLRPPLCSSIEVDSSIAEWEHLNTEQITVILLQFVIISKALKRRYSRNVSHCCIMCYICEEVNVCWGIYIYIYIYIYRCRCRYTYISTICAEVYRKTIF
uniref:ZP domain-containing protein n=1 Tax=Angiostrongylus cantonensis TaxID=6313 RepID=A0A158PBU6_ANGCA